MQRVAERLRRVSRLYRQSAYRRLVCMNLLLGFAMSFVQPFMSMFGTLEAKILPHHPGTATNVYANASRIGSTAGYFLFSVLALRFGYRAVFDACALFAVRALGLMLVPVAIREEPA